MSCIGTDSETEQQKKTYQKLKINNENKLDACCQKG